MKVLIYHNYLSGQNSNEGTVLYIMISNSANIPLFVKVGGTKGGTEGTQRSIVEFGVLLSNPAHSAHGIKDPNASDLL